MNENFRKYYLGEFEASEVDRYLYDLAEEYYNKCEEFDRLVCTGPMGKDGIMPANSYELATIGKHATKAKRHY